MKKSQSRIQILIVFLLTFFSLTSFTAQATVQLPKLVGDNMVLQRNQPVRLWGWADRGERIAITFDGQKLKTKADKNGDWQVTLASMKAGGPYEMTVTGSNEIVLRNILVGDVWVCSGQSNMEFVVRSAQNAEEEISEANYPEIRHFRVERAISFKPEDKLKGGKWEVCSPETVADFTAVGYFFARKLYQDTGVPIGLIHTSWGGTKIESWISEPAIAQLDTFAQVIDVMKVPGNAIKLTTERIYEQHGHNVTDDDQLPDFDSDRWDEMNVPAVWEWAGLYGYDGSVWYKKTINLPDSMMGHKAMLHLGTIAQADVCWINGHKIGESATAMQQQQVYLIKPEFLHSAANSIVVKITETGSGQGGFRGSWSDMFIESGGFRQSLAGTWQYELGEGTLNPETSPSILPSLLYNAMIHPVLPYTIKGFTWYQGESNTAQPYLYRKLFPMMIKDWRAHWGEGDLPFLFVQLANFMQPKPEPSESNWAELREAQSMTLSVPNTGMATIIDIGEANNIHPKDKQDVGKRLALAALKLAYNQDVVYSGPIFKSMSTEGNKVRLAFDHTGSGLMVKDKYGYVKGFAVAGPDKHFYWARGYLDGDEVVVWSNNVENPVAVRYAWADNPDDADLYNKEGLPASPFRTDDW